MQSYFTALYGIRHSLLILLTLGDMIGYFKDHIYILYIYTYEHIALSQLPFLVSDARTLQIL